MFQKTLRLQLLIHASVMAVIAFLYFPINTQAQTTKLPNLDSTLNKLDDKQLQKYAQSVGSNTQSLANKVKTANE